MIESTYAIRNLIRIFQGEGSLPIEVRPGQTLDVLARNSNNQEMMIPVTVLVVYPNGDYVGEVVWALA